MYSKPLATRSDGPQNDKATVRRPVSGAVNFASFLPMNGVEAPGIAKNASVDKTAVPGGAGKGASPANLGLNQTRALAALAEAKAEPAAPAKGTTSEGVSGQGMPLSPRDLLRLVKKTETEPAGKQTRERLQAQKKKKRGVEKEARPNRASLRRQRQTTALQQTEVGTLSARFESGRDGIAAVGYDRHGGTSYGKYQISSRAGTMRAFVNFLKKEAPDLADRLEKSGPMNTGARKGKMPDTWRKIAHENPERFERLQDRFIHASHYEPALRAITEKTGVAVDQMPSALQEVVFSTAVQHGPTGASRIIARALEQIGESKLDAQTSGPVTVAKAQENLIRKIYDNRSGQFGSSTQAVQSAVKNRLRDEMTLAIAQLRNERV